MKEIQKQKIIIPFVFGVTLLIMIIIGTIGLVNITQLETSQSEIIQNRNLGNNLKKLLANLQYADNNIKNFLITNDARHIEAFDSLQYEFEQTARATDSLAALTIKWQSVTKVIVNHAGSCMGALRQSLEQVRHDKSGYDQAVSLNQIAFLQIDLLSKKIDKVTRSLEININKNRAFRERKSNNLLFIFIFSSVVSIFLLALVYGVVARLLRKRIEAEVKYMDNLQMLESIFEHMPNAVYIKSIDDNFKYITLNKAAENALGLSRSDVIGKVDKDFLPADIAQSFAEQDIRASNMEKVEVRQEYIPNTEGTYHIFHTRKIAVKDSVGTPKYILGISDDITNLVNLEKARNKAHQELEIYSQTLEKKVEVRTIELQKSLNELKVTNEELLSTVNQLNQTKFQLQLALKAAKLGLGLFDIRTSKVQLDPQLEVILGLSPGDVSTKNQATIKDLLKLVHPDDRRAFSKAMSSLVRERKVIEIEYRTLRPNGQIRWVRAWGDIIYGENKKPVGAVGIFYDITERKETEYRLQQTLSDINQTRLKLQLAVTTAQMGIGVLNIKDNTIDMDAPLELLLGLAPGEFKNKYNGNLDGYMQFVHPDDRELILQTSKDIIENKKKCNIEYRIVRPNKSLRWFNVACESIYDKAGNPKGIIGVYKDITERHLAEAHRQANEELLTAVFEASADALLLYDAETRILENCNMAAVDLFEVESKDEIIGLQAVNFFKQPPTDNVKKEAIRWLHEKGSYTTDMEYVSRKGRVFWGNVALSFVNTKEKSMYLARIRDTTDIMRYQHDLETQKKQIETALHIIERDNERKTKELEDARNMQLSMLPQSTPELPNLDLAMYMNTSTEVGGDYYDYKVEEGVSIFVVGDATGHGLKSGIVVATAKSYFHNMANNVDVVQILQNISKGINSLHLRAMYMGITAVRVYGQRFTVASSGMPPFLMYSKQTNTVEWVLLKGPFLGSHLKTEILMRQLDLNTGDALLFMSDGLPERFNPQKELLDYDRIAECFLDHVDLSPEIIIAKLVAMGEKWAKGLPNADDITLVVMKVK